MQENHRIHLRVAPARAGAWVSYGGHRELLAEMYLPSLSSFLRCGRIMAVCRRAKGIVRPEEFRRSRNLTRSEKLSRRVLIDTREAVCLERLRRHVLCSFGSP